MLYIDKLKPGDPVTFIKMFGGRDETFIVDDPPYDEAAQMVRLRQPGTKGRCEIAYSFFSEMANDVHRMRLLGPPVPAQVGCTCDLRGPNMWFGCRCGYMETERAEKEKA